MRLQKEIAWSFQIWLYFVVSNTTADRRRMEIIYSGHVQGVGFRYTAKTTAMGYEVTGTVRNLSDGRVELIAEGVRTELEQYRQAIREAGLKHFIRDEAITWGEAKNSFKGFDIVR